MTDDLPHGWAAEPLAAVAELVLGKMLDRGRARAGTAAGYLRNINVRWGAFDLSDILEMPFEEDEFERYTVRDGDVVVCEGGDPGRAAVWQGAPIFFQKALHRARPSAALLPDWLVHHLRHDASSGVLSAFFTGTTIRHLTGISLSRYVVRLPPVREQRRIVAKLEALNARSRRAKEALDAIPALIEKFKQSVLAAAFRGDLTADWRAKHPDVEPASELLKRIRVERRRRWEEAELAKMRAKGKTPTDDRWKAKYEEPEPVDNSELPELPDTWCWAWLDEIRAGDAPMVYGIILPGDDVLDGVPYVRPIDIDDEGRILIPALKRTSSDVAARYARARLKAGDVILSIVGTIGKVAVTPEELEGGNITQSSIRIRPGTGTSTSYVKWLLQAPQLFRQYEKSRFGNAVQRLNVEHVRQLVVPLAPLDEQEAVIRRLDEAFMRLRTIDLGGLGGSLAALDRSILAKAFRGDLVPQDATDEPASVLLERIRAERETGNRAKADNRGPGRRRAKGNGRERATP